ncbi:MAG: hemolysin III family protein [Ruminococcaceae bacterium]|nr:hemolysin III family protein [Oscillospiraceae bacterium]
MTRTKLIDRILPDYTKGEEIFNYVSHIVGVVFGIVALVTCVRISVIHNDAWGIVGSSIYGASLILLYTMSSLYHALPRNMGKKVMQVLDHCTIYFLISGTYTPILFCAIREVSPGWAWTIFGIVWGFAVVGAVFNAIDLKKFKVFSMICYLGMGWCIIIAAKTALQAMSANSLLWLLMGGIAYTVGAVLYGLGKKHKYMHSVFHLFVLAGSVLQYVAIIGIL